jgi:hypothetical protein
MSSPMSVRKAFIRHFGRGLRVIWPVLSGIIAFVAATGVVTGLVEGWGAGRGIYFAFVTALTIGYGDHVPTHPLTRVLALLAGLAGITMTALLAGVTVRAFHLSETKDGKD